MRALRPGKKFPVPGNRCSLGGLEGMFLKDEGFQRFSDRSSPPAVLDGFLPVESELQAEMRSLCLR